MKKPNSDLDPALGMAFGLQLTIIFWIVVYALLNWEPLLANTTSFIVAIADHFNWGASQ